MMINLDMDDQDWDGFSSDEHSSEESDVNCSMDGEMESDLVSVSFKHIVNQDMISFVRVYAGLHDEVHCTKSTMRQSSNMVASPNRSSVLLKY